MNSRRLVPYILALELFVFVSAISVFYSMRRTGGQFVYPLDDTYISMAMAKNIAVHGVMGLTPHEFSFSSSCPLWIWLIAGVYVLAGPAWWVPLALGILAGIFALGIAYRVLAAAQCDNASTTMGLLALCILAPLPAMALSGMEHALHIALVLWFVAGACRFLSGEGGSFLKLLALLPALVMVRYESLFLAGVFALLLAARKRWLYGLITMATAVAPAALLGAVSVSRGWQWLPNSLLLKGAMPDLSSFQGVLNVVGGRSIGLLFAAPHLAALVAALLAAYIWRAGRGHGFWTSGQLIILFALAGTFLHLQFASVGWFFRYEAYLVALGVTAVFVSHADIPVRAAVKAAFRARPSPRLAAGGFALLLGLAPLAARALEAFEGLPAASHNVFEQQYQMALFLRTYYPGASIAANDVGAINYFADFHCLDLAGLCSREIGRLKRRRDYDTQAVATLAAAAGVRIAAVYDTWFNGIAGPRIPSGWIRVGSWHVSDNQFLGGDTVSFYAVQPEESEFLERCLREFSWRLPSEVNWEDAHTSALLESGHPLAQLRR
jgi:hypothetical protein